MADNKIDYFKKIEAVVAWVDEYLKRANAKGFVFGVSGGIDSALLCAIANKYFPNKSLALVMNIDNSEQDMKDAELVINTFTKVKHEIVDVQKVFDCYKEIASIEPISDVAASLKPRIRMSTLYLYGQKNNYLVASTSNAAEYTVGYFTKHGDTGSDIMPLVNFPKLYINECAKLLGVPQSIIDKRPSAGLKPDQYDEDELELEYTAIDDFLLGNFLDNRDLVKIIKHQMSSEHKRQPPASPIQKGKIL